MRWRRWAGARRSRAAYRFPMPCSISGSGTSASGESNRAASVIQDGPPPPAADSRVLRFARSGLMLAWHLAQLDPRVARLALGVEPGTQESLESLPVGALDAFARRLAPIVSARFCTRERFWAQIAVALRTPTASPGLDRLKLLGLQLQGAEAARAQQLHRRLRRSTQA
jgi:hypothetical protein